MRVLTKMRMNNEATRWELNKSAYAHIGAAMSASWQDFGLDRTGRRRKPWAYYSDEPPYGDSLQSQIWIALHSLSV